MCFLFASVSLSKPGFGDVTISRLATGSSSLALARERLEAWLWGSCPIRSINDRYFGRLGLRIDRGFGAHQKRSAVLSK